MARALAYLIIIVLALLAQAIAGCSTPEKAAQRKLRKALKLDPTIVSRYTTDTTIRDTINYTAKTVIPAKSGSFYTPDSIYSKNFLDRLKATGKPQLLGKDSKVSISVGLNDKGEPELNYDIPATPVEIPVFIPYEKKIQVPGKLIKQEVDKPAYKYLWFWALLSLNVLFLYIFVSRNGKVIYMVNQIKERIGSK